MACLTLLKYDIQKGIAEAMRVAALYIIAYKVIFHKSKICENESFLAAIMKIIYQ